MSMWWSCDEEWMDGRTNEWRSELMNELMHGRSSRLPGWKICYFVELFCKIKIKIIHLNIYFSSEDIFRWIYEWFMQSIWSCFQEMEFAEKLEDLACCDAVPDGSADNVGHIFIHSSPGPPTESSDPLVTRPCPLSATLIVPRFHLRGWPY